MTHMYMYMYMYNLTDDLLKMGHLRLIGCFYGDHPEQLDKQFHQHQAEGNSRRQEGMESRRREGRKGGREWLYKSDTANTQNKILYPCTDLV